MDEPRTTPAGALPSPRRRAAIATLLLALQLAAVTALARARFDLPFDRAPGSPPAITTAGGSPVNWNRLIVARWDAQHYVNLALRGYADCPESLRRTGELPSPPTMRCDLAFFPGYAVAGRAASLGGILPVDVALFAISLVSSWLFFFLWTGPEIVAALGLRATYTSLAAFNLFTTGFTVVTVQTEPPLLAATLGAFVLARRGRLFPAAIAAGAATGLRVSGVATGLALAALIAVDAWRERLPPARWAGRALLAALGFWGLALTVAYDAIALHDPLLYVHAHAQSFGHRPSLAALLLPDASWLLRSFTSPLHEGVWVAAALLWFALGHREALGRFDAPARAYWYVLTAGVLGVSLLGSVSRSFIGMNRYALAALPIFFAMGKVLEQRRLALAAWLALSAWHYWNVDLCYYVGDQGAETTRRCRGVACADR